MSLATTFGIIYLVGFPGRRRRLRVALGMGVVGLLCFALGCGGGGGSTGGGGGGGGGGTTPHATSVTLTTSNAKVPQNGQLALIATVTGGQNLAGNVTFYDYGSPLAGGFPVTSVNNQVQIGTDYLSLIGVHQITAKYSGDPNNLASSSPSVNQAITGTTSLIVDGATGSDAHSIQVTISLQ
jgi:hypothetical protein